MAWPRTLIYRSHEPDCLRSKYAEQAAQREVPERLGMGPARVECREARRRHRAKPGKLVRCFCKSAWQGISAVQMAAEQGEVYLAKPIRLSDGLERGTGPHRRAELPCRYAASDMTTHRGPTEPNPPLPGMNRQGSDLDSGSGYRAAAFQGCRRG